MGNYVISMRRYFVQYLICVSWLSVTKKLKKLKNIAIFCPVAFFESIIVFSTWFFLFFHLCFFPFAIFVQMLPKIHSKCIIFIFSFCPLPFFNFFYYCFLLFFDSWFLCKSPFQVQKFDMFYKLLFAIFRSSLTYLFWL